MKKSVLVSCIALGLISTSGFAYQEGDVIVQVGAVTVQPQGDGALDGALDVAGDTQLGLTLTYMLGDQLGIKLLAATPFSHDIEVSGDKVGETKHLPPTLTVQYHFLPESKFNPYVGAGINYTTFFEEKIALGELELDDSLSYAIEAGFNYTLDEHWGAGLSIWYADIETDASLNGADLDTVQIDPIVVLGAFNYRF